MSKVIKLKKGLDISLVGEALQEKVQQPLQGEYALVPDDFRGVIPKMLVKEGEAVKVGTPLFFDKYHPEVLFCSPVSGTLAAVVRGAKRKIMKVVVAADAEQTAEHFEIPDLAAADKVAVTEVLLKAGFWPMIKKVRLVSLPMRQRHRKSHLCFWIRLSSFGSGYELCLERSVG